MEEVGGHRASPARAADDVDGIEAGELVEFGRQAVERNVQDARRGARGDFALRADVDEAVPFGAKLFMRVVHADGFHPAYDTRILDGRQQKTPPRGGTIMV